MQRQSLVLFGALMLCCGTAIATDGYFQHGYGIQAKGRGGTSMALPTDAFGGANNPATMAMAGNRLELGLDLFSPRRSAERSGFGPGLDGSVDSGKTWFGIPELGYNHMLRDDVSLGVSVYGNGGMNTDYPGGSSTAAKGRQTFCAVSAPSGSI